MNKSFGQIIPTGYTALIRQFNLTVLPHYRSSYIALTGDGYVKIDDHQEIHVFRKKYRPKEEGVFEQLEFALKYDGVNLEILSALFDKIGTDELVKHIQSSPTGKYVRIIWFLYEWLTGSKLNIQDLKVGNYVKVLNTQLYYTTDGTRSQRHRVINNFLGGSMFCPVIRKSDKLQEFELKHLDRQADELIEAYDPNIVARAAQYLFTKETLSSYAIESEKPSKKREFRYVELLKSAYRISEMTKETLIELQKATVDQRFANVDYRNDQNYVGETINPYLQRVHYISPLPQDVPELMDGLLNSLDAMVKTNVHPVIIAAAISFGFVFIHPFDDGNGRLHRFLIHYVLSITHFTPNGVIFPISSVMIENMREYDSILERFSKPLMKIIDYEIDNDGIVNVTSNSLLWYQYIDFTSFAEYLFSCIERTIQSDFQGELEFIAHYDVTKIAVQEFIDMPDRLIDLAIKFVYQNKGKLAKSKRSRYFESLDDTEITQLEEIISTNMEIR